MIFAIILTIFITIFPTLLFYLFFNKLIKSGYLKISLSWFCGQYFFSIFVFILCLLFSFLKSNSVLQKALLISILCLLLVIIFIYKQILLILKEIKIDKTFILKTIFLFMPFFFSVFFYRPHLRLENGYIYTSPVYWDFQWHAPLIQNFVFGDNYPPENESFSGMPATYHFFWGFLTAIYASSGLDLVHGLNCVSILSLFFLLISIIGIGEELFKSFTVGILAAFLTITSSSLRFVDYFLSVSGNNPLQIIQGILTKTEHPFFFSFVSGNQYVYNGTMFNMFYFLAERQMVMGVIFLLFFIWLVNNKNKIPNKFLLIIGALMGVYFLWHLFITIIIFCSLLFIFLFGEDKKKSLILLFSFSFVFLSFVLYFKNLTESSWFYSDIKNFPKINFNFATMGNNYPFSITNLIGYYFYGYGLKLIFLVVGFILLAKKSKKIILILSSIIIPTFILVNTIQLSPLSIYDNHKWLRPMNIVVDLISAFAIYKIITFKKKFVFCYAGIVFLFLITISGIIELTPFFNSKPTSLYVNYQTSLISFIREKTNPKSVFLSTKNSRLFQIAGRKLFLGDYAGQDLRLRKDLREKIIKKIYSSNNLKVFCPLVLENKIDYIEIQGNENVTLIDQISKFDIGKGSNKITIIDAKKSCERW